MERGKYTDRNNLRYMLKKWRDFDKMSFVLFALRIPPLVVLPIIMALIPKLMIDAIDGGYTPGKMLSAVGLMSFLIAAITWINPFLESKSNAVAENINTDYRINAFKKMMSAGYEYVESLDGRLAFEKSKGFTESWGVGARGLFSLAVKFISNAVGIFTYIVILAVLDPILILIIAAAGIANFFVSYLNIKADKKIYDGYKVHHMKTNYVFRTANDFAAGKDIRVFGFKRLFDRVAAAINAAVKKDAATITKVYIASNAARAFLTLICESAAFYYLLTAALNDVIAVSDFVFYFALVTGFLGWIFSLTRNIFDFKRICFNCGRYREFIDETNDPSGERDMIPLPSADEFPCDIEFQDVTFAYRGSAEPTIRNMSFKIKKGEKIAVVGENGAGKTTCVKLICGFYRPSSGRILLNGIDISGFDPNEYFKLFSAVFQDYILLPMSIEKNIVLKDDGEAVDAELLQYVLAASGLKDKTDRLTDGIGTKLVKKVYEDAVNLSGGETQKLLLARALYKGAPILILDEPTAALDPIAENDMYLKYNGFTQNKTSFFISHRLSSTRFCDRIFFIKDGGIAESGTHEELMDKKGEYFKMYRIQSYYYKLGNDF
ncbi:MAG: ABC transporter ATP-binding protein/permease [Clostridiales bacterium]|nr:ABC transporter ATP-binding protein/permease [Clostridiales bacterium]